MTVTIKCQYTGIEFEARSKRAKNHPLVTEMLDQYKNDWKSYPGAYDELKNALKSVHGAYDTAEEAMEAARETYLAWRNGETSIYEQRRAEQQARRERREARRAQNDYLRDHGYTWHKNDDDGYQPMFASDDWHLVSPDGRVVSVAQALDEIERGAEVVLAEIEANEAKDRVEREAIETKKEAEEAAFYQALTEATSGLSHSEPFEYHNFQQIAKYCYSSEFHKYHRLYIGSINGERAAVVVIDMSDDDACTYYRESGGYEPTTLDAFFG